jgi:hypothetical protein
VGGDLRRGSASRAAPYVDGSGSLRADAIATGDSGTIIVWSDEATRYHGALSARGGALGGWRLRRDLGRDLVARGSVDLGERAGYAGVTLRPEGHRDHAGTLDGSDAPDPSDAVLANGRSARCCSAPDF